MPEVVVAYAQADEDAAALVIKKLEQIGFKVTREEAGARQARRAAKPPAAPVLLLWSRAFAKVNVAPKRPLATLRLDAAPPPAMVKAPAIDLRAWRGREDHRGWRKLKSTLAPRAAVKATPVTKHSKEKRPAMTEAKPQAATSPSRKATRVDALIFLAFLALAAGGGYYALVLR